MDTTVPELRRESVAPSGAHVAPNRRVVVETSEYQDVAVPVELLLMGGQLDVYPELTRAGILRTYSRGGSLYFQAGGWIGFIPINERVALEIRPRVPIVNLERVLRLADSSSPIVLNGHLNLFTDAKESPSNSFLDVIASRLSTLAEMCWNEGLHSDYIRVAKVAQSPRGRLKPVQTSLLRLKLGGRPAIAFEQFEKTHDTVPNQCIAAALDKLHVIYSCVGNRAGVRVLATRLARARQLFHNVSRLDPGLILHTRDVLEPERLPACRPSYPAAIAIARIVLSGRGVDIRSRDGQLSLPPMIISMEVAFEAYLRTLLSSFTSGLTVLDGNLAPPVGASRKLFHSAPTGSPMASTKSTPDIVVYVAEDEDNKVIIDAKYKPDVSRDDLNQVLGYAMTYGSKKVMLACPRKSRKSSHGLQLLGEVGGVSAYQYWIDLGSDDLEREEAEFAGQIQALLKR